MDYYDENNEHYEEVEDENLDDDEDEEGDAWDDSALIAAWDLAVKEFQATSRIEVLEDFHSIKASTSKSSAENDISDTTPAASENLNKMERLVNITKENTFESFVQPDTFDENEDASTSEFVKKDIVNEQIRKFHESPERKSKPSKPQPDNDANPTSHTNVHDSFYSGDHSHGTYYPDYYTPPPPPPGGPHHQFYPPYPQPTDPNIPPKAPVPIPGFDDEALSNLIMAWYYSGYYTGLYQGRKGR
ncbi:16086_t:CDS:2 [Funneliformis mosseae]|uniref:16086_t:CDS:1 n=1 Tax=Funneliformis mosseae TaxID=27381 RepID=A0A9N9FB36_FUNMO|nr:16086_t:CDS:2 [Funneliformis mosseae]